MPIQWYIMLVEALLLRHRGIPIDPVVLRKATPLRGELIYKPSYYKGRDGRGLMNAMLLPAELSLPEVTLYGARILKVEQRGILIAGEEEEWNRKICKKFRQTMWAWPPGPGPISEKPEDPEISRKTRDFLAEIGALA
jgi:hypothetical protein